MFPAPCTPSVTCLCSRTHATRSPSSLPVPAGQGQLWQPRGVGGRTPLHAQCNSPEPKRRPAPRSPRPLPRYTKGTGGCIKVGISLGPGWCELGGVAVGGWFLPVLPSLLPWTSYVVCPVWSPLPIALHLVWSDWRVGWEPAVIDTSRALRPAPPRAVIGPARVPFPVGPWRRRARCEGYGGPARREAGGSGPGPAGPAGAPAPRGQRCRRRARPEAGQGR